jgi:hypothetical protein
MTIDQAPSRLLRRGLASKGLKEKYHKVTVNTQGGHDMREGKGHVNQSTIIQLGYKNSVMKLNNQFTYLKHM